MKKLLRNSIIRTLSIFGITALYRHMCRRHGPLVRVVVFHDISDREWFLHTIAFLSAHYTVLTPKEFSERRFDPHTINVLITFDDGYESWTDVCIPILNESGIKAVFFINSGLLDADGDAQGAYIRDGLLLTKERAILTWEGLVQLQNGGHTIGGHTRSHIRLSQLKAEDQMREIESDKHRIESVLTEKMHFFAYPFGNSGDFTDASFQAARATGYDHIFSTEVGFVLGEDTGNIPRLCLEEGMEGGALASWIEGGYDLYARIKKLCVG